MTDLELSRLFLAVVALLVAALGGGYVFDRLGLPRVVGEITGGALLGPSALGLLIPDIYAWLYQSGPEQTHTLEVLYWIGLVLLMFISGFRVQQHLSRDDGLTIAAVFFAATVPPFAVGWMIPDWFDLTPYMGSGAHPMAFRIVVAIAMTVTSIPVISKIFIDLDIIDTRLAKIVLACSTVQDLLLWSALAVATGLASGVAGAGGLDGVENGFAVRKVAITLGFLGVSLLIGRTLMWRAAHMFPAGAGDGPPAIGLVLGVCFVFAAVASLLGVNAVFGALVAGIAIGALPQAGFTRIKDRISDVSLAFFVPVYFALVGLRIDLPNFLDGGFTLAFLVGSTLLVMVSVMAGAKLVGKSLLTSLNLGMAMNTRGGPGIVLASVAFAFGIINQTFFVTLVIAAVVTSLVSGAWFRFVRARGLELYN
jgi:Kef-type K+ transport system membrane component KefB